MAWPVAKAVILAEAKRQRLDTNYAIAKAAGMNPNSLNRLFTLGKDATFGQVRSIVLGLGKSLSWLEAEMTKAAKKQARQNKAK